MGFFSTLKEKLTGKKVETTTNIPTLDEIHKENADLTKVETQTVETVVNAQTTAPAADTSIPTIDPIKEVNAQTLEQKTEVAAKAKPKRKAAKKAVAKKAAPKKAVAKKVVVKKAAPKKVVKKIVKKAVAKKKRR